MNAKQLYDRLRKLAVDQSGVAAKELREQARQMVTTKYAATFMFAKEAGNEKLFITVADKLKADMKARGELIDRDFSNAASAVKRYWKACREVCDLHDGKHVVHVKQKGSKELKAVTLTPNLANVESFNQLKQCADALTSNGGLSSTIAGKLSALQGRLRAADEVTANAALDAALAYFLTGTKPKKQPSRTQAAKAKGATKGSRTPKGVELKAATTKKRGTEKAVA